MARTAFVCAVVLGNAANLLIGYVVVSLILSI